MEAEDLREFARETDVLLRPNKDYGMRVCQGRLMHTRPRPDEWELYDYLAPHDQIHPKFRAKDVSRVVQVNDIALLLMVYPEQFSAAARKYEIVRRRQESKGGPYGKA